MDIEKLKKIFALYEYKLLKETDDYIIYNEGHSMYPGVEIVCLTETGIKQQNNLKKDFSDQGYAVRVCMPQDADHIEDYLFDWFFRVKSTNSSIKERYKLYSDAVIRAYGLPEGSHKQYEYVDIPYVAEYDFKHTIEGQKSGLIPAIKKDIESEGPRLIIVEAAAGFGKTSTAMELLMSYSDVEHSIRPFYMELYRDRQAALFKYLYLAQIHREFQVLMDDKIVEYNISQGRIPLIIDGFDELLSEDLDSGNTNRARKKGETMLSTIADLLHDNAKVVLTTRKTAVLSGEEFLEWYQGRFGLDSKVHLSRYVLGQPMLDNWLSSSQIRMLGDKITGISNPVLLGYLKYLNKEDFIIESKSSSLIEGYVKRLLEREIERQGLTLTVSEQIKIYEWLSMAFVYDDITSDTRSNVKDNILLLCSDIIQKHQTITKDAQSIANTLTNHALLDRKGGSTIGFINDFVLGIFMGYAIVDETEKGLVDYYKSMSPNFVEKLINTAASTSKDNRESLWVQLNMNCPHITKDQWMMIDLKLMHRNMTNYENQYFDGITVVNATFGFRDAQIIECHFVNYVFENVTFNLDYVQGCTFINCTFNKVKFDNIGNDSNDYFNCVADGKEIPVYEEEPIICDEQSEIQNETSLILSLLAHYFQVDGKTRKMQMISKLKLDYNDNKSFKRIFSKLESKKYILVNGDKTFITNAGSQFYFEKK